MLISRNLVRFGSATPRRKKLYSRRRYNMFTKGLGC